MQKRPTYDNYSGGRIPAIEKCLRDICAYLPTLELQGDNQTISIDRSKFGQVIRGLRPKAIQMTTGGGGTPVAVSNKVPISNINRVSFYSPNGDYENECKSYLENVSNPTLSLPSACFVNINGIVGKASTSSSARRKSFYSLISSVIDDSSISPRSNSIINGVISVKATLSKTEQSAGSLTFENAPVYFNWNLELTNAVNELIGFMPSSAQPSAWNWNVRDYQQKNWFVEEDNASAYFVPIARYTIWNSETYINEYRSSHSSNAPVNIALENIDSNPQLMIALTQDQINALYAANERINE